MEHRKASRHSPIGRASALFLVAGILVAALSAASLLGPVESIAFLLLGLATFTAIVVGLLRYRPDPMWPWLSITGALSLPDRWCRAHTAPHAREPHPHPVAAP